MFARNFTVKLKSSIKSNFVVSWILLCVWQSQVNVNASDNSDKTSQIHGKFLQFSRIISSCSRWFPRATDASSRPTRLAVCCSTFAPPVDSTRRWEIYIIVLLHSILTSMSCLWIDLCVMGEHDSSIAAFRSRRNRSESARRRDVGPERWHEHLMFRHPECTAAQSDHDKSERWRLRHGAMLIGAHTVRHAGSDHHRGTLSANGDLAQQVDHRESNSWWDFRS